MSEEKNSLNMGTKHEGDLPADAELVEGHKPSNPEPKEDVEGRDHHHNARFLYVTCPHHDCHSSNGIWSNVHWVHCWNCHRTFHT